MHKVRGNSSSCTGRSSENICTRSTVVERQPGRKKESGDQNMLKLSLPPKKMVHF